MLESIIRRYCTLATPESFRLVSTHGPERSDLPLPRAPDGSINVSAVMGMVATGSTLILNGVHRMEPRLGGFCDELSRELGHRVGANMYITPPSRQGFPPHFDSHDVFVVQLMGSKRWTLFEGGPEAPLADQQDFVNASDLGEPILNAVLQPGATLYIPRGVVHQAQAGRRLSVHLTIGVHVRRWLDLLEVMLRKCAREDVLFRRARPTFAAERHDDDRMAGMQRMLVQSLMRQSVLAAVQEDEAQVGRWPSPPFGRILEPLLHQRPIGATTRLRHRQGAQPTVELQGDSATISFDHQRVSGPAEIHSALLFIAAHRRFKVAELPDSLTAASKVMLVQRLVAEGLLSPI